MKDFLVVFEHTISTSAKALREIIEEKNAVKPAFNKWSQKEILGHLIDSAFNMPLGLLWDRQKRIGSLPVTIRISGLKSRVIRKESGMN